MLFCVVGSFAINNTAFDVTVMLVAGVAAYVMEDNGFPIAPAILGVVLGGMLEENFVSSVIKSDGSIAASGARRALRFRRGAADGASKAAGTRLRRS